MLAAVSVFLIVAVAVAVGVVITLALSGVLAERFPVLDARLAELTRHLNGDADAPERVQRIFNQ